MKELDELRQHKFMSKILSSSSVSVGPRGPTVLPGARQSSM